MNIGAKALSTAFNLLSNAVPRKSSYPILSSIAFKISGAHLELFATDLDCFAIARTELDLGTEAIECIIPYQIIKEYLALEKRDLSISVDEQSRLTFKTDSSVYRFYSQSVEEFPAIPRLGQKLGVIEVNTGELIKIINLASDSADTKALNSNRWIQIEAKKGNISINGCSGLTAVSQAVAHLLDIKDNSWTIEPNIAKALKRVKAEMVKINLYSGYVSFEAEGVEFVYTSKGKDFAPIEKLDTGAYSLFECSGSDLQSALKNVTKAFNHQNEGTGRVSITSDAMAQKITVSGQLGTVEIHANVWHSQQIELCSKIIYPTLKKISNQKFTLAIALTNEDPGRLAIINSCDTKTYFCLFKNPSDPSPLKRISCERLDISKCTTLSLSYELNNSEQKLPQNADMFNYFAELAQAREAGIWTQKRHPRKSELVEAISAHEKASVPDSVSLDTLRKHESKASKKSRSWDEVWEASKVGSMKSDSYNGIVLQRMAECGVKLDEYDILGLPSRRQVSQAIASISEKGYGVKKELDIYYLVLPAGMEKPCLR